MSSQQVSLATAVPRATGERTEGRLPLVALCLGFVMIMMDVTVVNTALAGIGRDLSATISGLQWVIDGYTLIFACLLLSAGSFGDRLGARRVFLLGLVLFTAASVGCGLAPTLGVLNGARVAQGIGAALVLPTSLALINASYPDRTQRARAIGVWGGLGGIGAGLGPVLGGILTSWWGWPAIFFINVPIGIAAIMLTLRHVVAPAPSTRTSLDPLGQVLAVVTVAGLAYGLIEGGAEGWTAPAVVGAFVAAVLGGIGFGTAYTMPAATATTIEAAPSERAGIASGVLNSSRQIGSTLGVAVFGTLLATTGTFMTGYHLSVLIGGLVFVAGALIALLTRRPCGAGPRSPCLPA